MASRECIVRVCAYLGAAFGDRFPPRTATDMEVWLDVLHDTDDAVLIAAVRDFCRTDERFPPTPGQLLALAERDDVRVYADRAHRPFPDAVAAPELEQGYPDPLRMMRAVKSIYDERFRPDLRLVEGEAGG